MSQRPSVDFSGRSPLHPSLKAALSSLDLQLEAELARYQRQRTERSVKANARLRCQQAAEIDSDSELPPADDSAAQKPPINSQSLSEDLVFSLVHQSHQAIEGDLIPPADTQVPPDDYLESSERLLRTLAEKKSLKGTDKSLVDNLLTPLGIGSMLLFLMANIVLVSAFHNLTKTTPAQFEHSQEHSIPNSPNLAAEEFINLDLSTLSTIDPGSPSVAPTPSQTASPSPATTQVSPRIASSPAAVPGSTSELATALLPPSLRIQQVQPSVVSSSAVPVPYPPAPTQLSPSPAATTVPTITPDNYYYVLADYTSDRSLEQARKAIRNAYVRDFPQGRRIQMGAFLKQDDANRLVEQLKQQGISASVYHSE